MHPLWTFLVMRAATCSDSALQLQACKGLTDEVPSGDVVAGLARKTEQGRTVCGIPSCKLTAESSGDAEGGARYRRLSAPYPRHSFALPSLSPHAV